MASKLPSLPGSPTSASTRRASFDRASQESKPDRGSPVSVKIAFHKAPFNLGTPLKPTQWSSPPARPVRPVSRSALVLQYAPVRVQSADLRLDGSSLFGSHDSRGDSAVTFEGDTGSQASALPVNGASRAALPSHQTRPPQSRGFTAPQLAAPAPAGTMGPDLVAAREGAEPARQRKKLLAPALSTGAAAVRPFTTTANGGQPTWLASSAWSTPAYALDPSAALLAARPLTTPNSPNALAHKHPFQPQNQGIPVPVVGNVLGDRRNNRESHDSRSSSDGRPEDRVWGFNTGNVLPLLQPNVVRDQDSFCAYVEEEAAATGGLPPPLDVPLDQPWTKKVASVFDKPLPVRSGGPYVEGQTDDTYWRLLRRAHMLAGEGHCVGRDGMALRQKALLRAIEHDPTNPYGCAVAQWRSCIVVLSNGPLHCASSSPFSSSPSRVLPPDPLVHVYDRAATIFSPRICGQAAIWRMPVVCSLKPPIGLLPSFQRPRPSIFGLRCIPSHLTCHAALPTTRRKTFAVAEQSSPASPNCVPILFTSSPRVT